jgi:hypothetical protein
MKKFLLRLRLLKELRFPRFPLCCTPLFRMDWGLAYIRITLNSIFHTFLIVGILGFHEGVLTLVERFGQSMRVNV